MRRHEFRRKGENTPYRGEGRRWGAEERRATKSKSRVRHKITLEEKKTKGENNVQKISSRLEITGASIVQKQMMLES